MKRFIIALIVTIVLLVSFNAIDYATVYEKDVVVMGNTDNIVTCVDNSGHLWRYEGQAVVGERITLIMHDNNTDMLLTDDIVKGVKAR